jgi:hypothetical protein
MFVFNMTVPAAQTRDMITIKVGQQKVDKASGLRIKFVSVVEDSRCPVDVDCIHAGNSRIQVRITGERSSKDFEFNTTIGPKGDMLDGWAIYLEELTPLPRSNKKTNKKLYTAKFRVSRLTR